MVRVPGLRRLRADLRKLGDDLAELKEAGYAAGRIVLGEAVRRAPRRSGRLAATGRAARAVSRVSVSFGRAAVPYAGVIHYGWPAHGIDPQPFAIEAGQVTEPAWLAVYAGGIDRAIDKRMARTY